jgi:hypothetical protein
MKHTCLKGDSDQEADEGALYIMTVLTRNLATQSQHKVASYFAQKDICDIPRGIRGNQE